MTDAFWRLWPSAPILREAQHGELAAGEAVLERLEFVRLDLAVGDVRLHAVAFGEGVGELAQAPDALGEHDHLLLARRRRRASAR